MFWKNHNSTQCMSRQYMSAIFYHDDEQRKLAQESMKQEQKKKAKTIVTKILPAQTFYNAEDYHQKYLLRQHNGLLRSLGLLDQELIRSHAAARLNGYMGGYASLQQFEDESKKLGLSDEQIDFVKSRL